MNQWKSELATLALQWPSFLSRIIAPKLIFLPHWWPVKFNAWAYGFCIFIGPGLRDAPDDARNYIIGHEYGHIYCNHTILHFVYWLMFVALFAGDLAGFILIKGLALISLVSIALYICLPTQAKKREFEADAIALSIFGQPTVLNGSLWMADKTGTLNNFFRQLRLAKIGWKPS